MVGRIDVHAHMLPPSWRDGVNEFGRNPGNYPTPPWSPESALTFMDSQKIETTILSLTTPGISYWAPEELRSAARMVNDYTTELCVKHPGRFGNFATLPLPDVDGSIADLSYALDDQKADGVVLYTNYRGKYLGDPMFDPLWAELDKREAMVFIHPGILTLPELPATPAAFVDFPFDTTRTAVDIVLKGVFDRYKKVKVLLSHAGGFVPYQAYRFAGCASVMPNAPTTEDILAKFRRFYFDTALSAGTSTLLSLKAFADPSRILFGSDYPYAPKNLAQDMTAMFDKSEVLTDQERVAINRTNSTALFPRFST